MEYMKWTGRRGRRSEPTVQDAVWKGMAVQRMAEEAFAERNNGVNQRGTNRGYTARKRTWQQSVREAAQELGGWIAANRRAQGILLLCGILLVGVVTKWITNWMLYRDVDMAEAFITTKSGCVETRLQVTADYGTDFLTEHDKQLLMEYMAGALGVTMDGAADMKETDASQVYTWTKPAARAETTLKVVTQKGTAAHTYLYVELAIFEDSQYDILEYRDKLVRSLEDLSVLRVETTLQFLGAYEGNLDLSEWKRISNGMIKELNGKIIYENRDPDLYTVYAYSAGLPEYITSNGKEVNIQVAMRYEPDRERTVVYLASPIIREDW